MSYGLDGKQVIVTGGGTGIGRAIVGSLARVGAIVTVVGRRESVLAEVVRSGDAADSLVADVTDEGAIEKGLRRIADRYGRPLVLVNAAGAAESAPFARSDAGVWDRMLRVNLLGAVHCARAVLPGMLEEGWGRIVNLASTAALRGYPYVTAYAAAKHGLLGFTRSLALEVAQRGVTVNAVCPGFSDTEMVAESVARIVEKTGRTPDEARADLSRHNPQGRLVQPEEVAALVRFLCTPAASAINGRAVAVDGGEVP